MRIRRIEMLATEINRAIRNYRREISAEAIAQYGEPNFPWDDVGCHFNPHKKTILSEECLTNYLCNNKQAFEKWIEPHLELE